MTATAHPQLQLTTSSKPINLHSMALATIHLQHPNSALQQ
jgi:hypothetical protein